MAKNSKISSEDRALFRESIGTVRRLKQDNVVTHTPRPRPAPRRRHPDEESEASVQDTISDEYYPTNSDEADRNVGFARSGIQQSVLRKLRRGQFTPEAELDLHDLTVAQARATLLHFLQQCHDRGVRHARIIHGQGNSSREGRPVLKGKVYHWLQQLDDVLAVCPARPEHGGGGALYLLLKRH